MDGGFQVQLQEHGGGNIRQSWMETSNLWPKSTNRNETKWNESALTSSAFENRVRAGLVQHTMQTNPAIEQRQGRNKFFQALKTLNSCDLRTGLSACMIKADVWITNYEIENFHWSERNCDSKIQRKMGTTMSIACEIWMGEFCTGMRLNGNQKPIPKEFCCGGREQAAVAILNFKLLWIVFWLTCCPPTPTSDDNRATVNDARRSRGDAPRVERSRPGYNVRSGVILSAHAWTLAYNWKNIDALAERKIANRGSSCRATSRRRFFSSPKIIDARQRVADAIHP